MIRPMNTVTNIGLAGMKAAEMRVAIRATNIVQAPVAEAQAFMPVQTTRALVPTVKAQPIPRAADGSKPDTLAEDLVDLQIAQQAYRASAAVVRTGADMSRTLLDALA